MDKYFGMFVWVNDNPVAGSVLNLSNIAKPRRVVHEYQEMGVATVPHRGSGRHEAIIGRIGRKYICNVYAYTCVTCTRTQFFLMYVAWAISPGAQPTEQPRRVPRWQIRFS